MSAAITAAAVVAGGTYLASENAKDAANSQANALNQQSGLQYARAQDAAAKVPEFRPVTVTSSFGTPNYTYDENGRLTGVGSTAAPWLSSLQQRGQGLAGQYMGIQEQAIQNNQLLGLADRAYGAGGNVYDIAQQAAAQQQGLYGVGQEMYGLGRGLAPTAQQFGATGQALQGTGADIYAKAAQALPTSYDTTQATQDYYNRMQQLVAPQREQQLAKTRQSLFNTGRQGLAVGATQDGGMLATNPEMAAYYNAIAQQDLSLANQSQQQALANLQAQTNIGQGLYNTGLQQYQAGLNYGQSGVNTTGAMANILGQGNTATQAGIGAGQSAANLYATGTGLFGAGGALQNQYYTNLSAAQAPYSTGMSQLNAAEAMMNQPVTYGMDYGATATNQANKIAQAYINAAGAGSEFANSAINAQYRSDSIDPWSNSIIGAGKALGGTDWSNLFSNNSGGGGASTPAGYGQAANIQMGNTAPMFSNASMSSIPKFGS